jgi:colanic acid/amylovoran biosynthesis glycosyltransferase
MNEVMNTSRSKDKHSRETVGYVLRKFPVLSETFILNEILALEARGIPVHIFSLERPNDPRFHENLPKLQASISYLPDVADVPGMMKFHERVSRRYGDDFKKALAYALDHHRPGLFWRFLQGCYIADQVRRFRIGHFHAHFATRPTSLAFFAAMISGLPYSFSAHAMDIFKSHLSNSALARKIEHARFVVTISEFNRRLLEKIVPEYSPKIVRIYNGIDLERFTPTEARPAGPFTFLCVARLVEKKGHTILLDACGKLKEKGVPFECRIIGKGRLRSPLQTQIKEMDLGGHVKLLGPLRSGEVLEQFREAHASVLPCVEGSDGNKDGLPVSIVEALACGVPVVTTPMTGIPEVVEHEKNGLLVPFHDVGRLAEEMERIVMDTALYENLRVQARSSVVAAFDMRNTIMQLEELFRESLS